MIRSLAAAAALGLALAAGPASAQVQSSGTFDFYLRGIRAATLAFGGSETAGSYAAAGQLKSAGLVNLFRSMHYEAESRGTISGGRYVPGLYSEDADTGSRQSQSEMAYARGVPQVRRYSPPREPSPRDVKPETQAGTIDPMTAIFIGLRDTPRGAVCDYDSFMFDGRRRSRVSLSNPQAQGANVLCSGRYQRIAGFSDREMTEKTDFRFTLTYTPAGEGMMRVSEIAMDTVYGAARLVRR